MVLTSGEDADSGERQGPYPPEGSIKGGRPRQEYHPRVLWELLWVPHLPTPHSL